MQQPTVCKQADNLQDKGYKWQVLLASKQNSSYVLVVQTLLTRSQHMFEIKLYPFATNISHVLATCFCT